MPEQDVQRNAESKLGEMIRDVTTLEVVTLSGNITVADLKVDQNKPVNFKQIIGEMHGNPDMASRIHVVAATKFAVDMDVQQFVKEDMSREEKELFMIHLETIQNAQQARQAAMQALLNIIKGSTGI